MTLHLLSLEQFFLMVSAMKEEKTISKKLKTIKYKLTPHVGFIALSFNLPNSSQGVRLSFNMSLRDTVTAPQTHF